MSAPPQPPISLLNTHAALLTTFSSFLTVSIHTILYERSLYPPSTFILTRAYNFPVRQNRHPKVCQWILDSVSAVEAQLSKSAVDKVVVVIFDEKERVLERYIFDVAGFPTIAEGERYTEFAKEDGDGQEGGKTVNMTDLEEQFRGAVRKLAYCGSKLGPLPEGCTFTIAVELKELADAPIGHPQPWIPSRPSLQTGEKGQSKAVGKDLGGLKSVPVRSVEAGEFVLEMWIEEGRAKLEAG